MDAIVRVTCPNCGDKDLSPQDMSLRVFEAIDAEKSWCIYRFICPECKRPSEQSGPMNTAKWLVRVGVAYNIEKVPEEARESHDGAPFTEADVETLLTWLDGDNPLENP